MKKSELTAYIKEEILASLTSEDTQQDIKDTEELTAAIEKLKKAKEEAGLSEENIGLADLEEMGYEAGVEGFTKVFNAMNFKNSPDFRAYKKGFIQGFTDESGAYGLSETVTEEGTRLAEEYSVFKNYDDIIGGIIVRFGALENYVKENEPEAMDDLQKIILLFNDFDEKMAYGKYGETKKISEEEDAPAGDKEIEKKASKQDVIIKNYQKLQRDLKRYLKSYKEAKGEEEKQDALKNMKKISQSAEYLDAKAKYEKLKKV